MYCLSSFDLVCPPIEGVTYRVSKPKTALARDFRPPRSQPLREQRSGQLSYVGMLPRILPSASRVGAWISRRRSDRHGRPAPRARAARESAAAVVGWDRAEDHAVL